MSFDIAKQMDEKLQKHFGHTGAYDSAKYYYKRGSCLVEYEAVAKKLYGFLLYVPTSPRAERRT